MLDLVEAEVRQQIDRKLLARGWTLDPESPSRDVYSSAPSFGSWAQCSARTSAAWHRTTYSPERSHRPAHPCRDDLATGHLLSCQSPAMNRHSLVATADSKWVRIAVPGYQALGLAARRRPRLPHSTTAAPSFGDLRLGPSHGPTSSGRGRPAPSPSPG